MERERRKGAGKRQGWSSVESRSAPGLGPQRSVTAKLGLSAIQLTAPRVTLMDPAEVPCSACANLFSVIAWGETGRVKLRGNGGREQRLSRPHADPLRGDLPTHSRQNLPGSGEGIHKSVITSQESYWLRVFSRTVIFSDPSL